MGDCTPKTDMYARERPPDVRRTCNDSIEFSVHRAPGRPKHPRK
ncbi:hypothetical protein AHF37_00824 [Paragonimus kellicotti]|nr:hypothetical protein AHF37_00824 [Paragonimus kellicotti]